MVTTTATIISNTGATIHHIWKPVLGSGGRVAGEVVGEGGGVTENKGHRVKNLAAHTVQNSISFMGQSS